MDERYEGQGGAKVTLRLKRERVAIEGQAMAKRRRADGGVQGGACPPPQHVGWIRKAVGRTFRIGGAVEKTVGQKKKKTSRGCG